VNSPLPARGVLPSRRPGVFALQQSWRLGRGRRTEEKAASDGQAVSLCPKCDLAGVVQEHARVIETLEAAAARRGVSVMATASAAAVLSSTMADLPSARVHT